MRGFVANTDYDWFTYLRAIEPPIDDVNFWKPGSQISFRALQPGEPLFFKLKAPRNVIAGFGYFAGEFKSARPFLRQSRRLAQSRRCGRSAVLALLNLFRQEVALPL